MQGDFKYAFVSIAYACMHKAYMYQLNMFYWTKYTWGLLLKLISFSELYVSSFSLFGAIIGLNYQ